MPRGARSTTQRRRSLAAGTSDIPLTTGSTIDGHAPLEVETFLPFAQKLSEWGYEKPKIVEVLLARGVRPAVAEHLARIVLDHE